MFPLFKDVDMIGIKLFIAGSTHPSAQRARDRARLRLSKLQNKLIAPDGSGVALFVHDFNDFKSQQEDYDQFIQNEADIFIAMVDANNDAGEGTYSEYITACESYKERGRPEIIVLYKTAKGKTRPPQRWTEPLKHIDGNKRYVIPEPTYHQLLMKLQEELVGNFIGGGRIHKFIPNNPVATKIAVRPKIGDIYDKDGLKGVIFDIDPDGISGKIISLRESIACTWQEWPGKKRKISSEWRAPSISELEQIVMTPENLKTINAAIKANKGQVLECDKWNNIFWSETKKNAFKQMAVRWFNSKRMFTLESFSNSLKGYIRTVADVKL